MKMVKSLLLGAAAGIVASAGAQAADLPVKAKPVQYVKICSLYGVGFYYIPGTDMCIKIGGWVRIQYQYDMNGNATDGPYNGNLNNRLTNDSVWRARGYITADARNQTPYGTVRSYIAIGYVDSDVGVGAIPAFQALRGFIQWAGFTFGQAQSFFDFYSIPATAYLAAYPAESTGGGGWKVLAYTAQFGNGFSGSISAEMRRTTQIICADDAFGVGGIVGACADASSAGVGAMPQASGSVVPWAAYGFGNYGGFQAPDIVANLRVEGAWGAAQVMGALHQVNAQYYDDNGNPPVTTCGECAGHPGDKWGFAVGVGLKLNAPQIGPGDFFQSSVRYTEGASRYNFQNNNYNEGARHGDSAGYGVLSDAVFGGTLLAANTTGLQLTSTWAVNAAFDHNWNANWKTSVYGGYAEVNYNSTANAILCGLQGDANATGTFNATGTGSTAVALNGCDNDWSTWWIGSRTQWSVTKDFYMGVDVLYRHLDSANAADGRLPNAATPVSPSGAPLAFFIDDQDALSVEFRVHKDFYP
jgi:hypothetical protein